MRVKVHKYYREHKTVRSHSRKKPRKGIIRSPVRRIIKSMTAQNIEFGGQIDFDKGAVERITTTPGRKYDAEPIVDEGFRVGYHSHPGKGKIGVLPSNIDLASMIKEKSQKSEVIFNKDHASIITKTNKAKNLRKKRMSTLEQYFNTKLLGAETKSRNNNELINNIKDTIEDEGFKIRIQRNNKNIMVPIR